MYSNFYTVFSFSVTSLFFPMLETLIILNSYLFLLSSSLSVTQPWFQLWDPDKLHCFSRPLLLQRRHSYFLRKVGFRKNMSYTAETAQVQTEVGGYQFWNQFTIFDSLLASQSALLTVFSLLVSFQFQPQLLTLSLPQHHILQVPKRECGSAKIPPL